MSKKHQNVPDPTAVSALIERLEEPLRSLVEAIRRTILDAAPEVAEQVKWNSPSFFFTGAMADFDPKTYARDIVVVDSRRGSPMLVFPTGAKIEGFDELLEKPLADGRRLARIGSMAEFLEKKDALEAAVRAWTATVERA